MRLYSNMHMSLSVLNIGNNQHINITIPKCTICTVQAFDETFSRFCWNIYVNLSQPLANPANGENLMLKILNPSTGWQVFVSGVLFTSV